MHSFDKQPEGVGEKRLVMEVREEEREDGRRVEEEDQGRQFKFMGRSCSCYRDEGFHGCTPPLGKQQMRASARTLMARFRWFEEVDIHR